MSHVAISSPVSQRSSRAQTRRGAANRTGRIDLLIVDDRPWASPRVSLTASSKGQIRLIATAASEQAVGIAEEQKPDVCMVSAGLDDWLSLVCRMKQLDQPPRMLVYCAAADTRMIGMAIIAETDGLLHRYAAAEELAEILRRMTSGARMFPSLQPDQFRELLDCVDDPDRAIAAMLLERVPPDQIANTLGLSARSLARRRQAILARLRAARGSGKDPGSRLGESPRT
jgi:DNA-binding NarL/FixJ family response regulator